MFLLSAHRVELEVQCDGERWSHLGSTRNLCVLRRHLLVLSVEALRIGFEFLHWSLILNLPGRQHHLAQHLTQHLATVFPMPGGSEILVEFVSVGWNPSDSPWSSPLKSSLHTSRCCLRVGSRNSWSRPDNFAVPSAIGKMNSSLLCGVNTSFALNFQGGFLIRPSFFSSSRSATSISPFQTLPRDQLISEKYFW